MAYFFIHSLSCPPFNSFRDESFLQMMIIVAGENEFKSPTITRLKTCLNAEHDAFEKASRQAVLGHC